MIVEVGHQGAYEGSFPRAEGLPQQRGGGDPRLMDQVVTRVCRHESGTDEGGEMRKGKLKDDGGSVGIAVSELGR